MRDSNQAVIARNYRVEEALEAAVERGDYRVMEKLIEFLSRPYQHSSEMADYCKVPAGSTGSYGHFCGT